MAKLDDVKTQLARVEALTQQLIDRPPAAATDADLTDIEVRLKAVADKAETVLTPPAAPPTA